MIFSRWIALLLALFAIAGCGSDQADSETLNSVISGTITYKQRMALSPQAEVIVTLEDVSRAGSVAVILGETRFNAEGKQVPLDFVIEYPASDIQQNHSYVVRAKIKLSDQLIFTTDTAYRVLTDANKTSHVDMDLVPVAR